MVASKLSYEESRLKRLEENKKRMEALNLPNLSQALSKPPSFKPSPVIIITPNPSNKKKKAFFLSFFHCMSLVINYIPHSMSLSLFKNQQMKPVTPRRVEKQLVVVRRSSRVANKPAPDYKEEVHHVRVAIPRRMGGISKKRDLSNRVYASDEARAEALEKAEKLELRLEPAYPIFIKSMLQSHVTGGFWLGLPRNFCKKCLPKTDEIFTLVDESGNEYPTVYLARKTGLSGGWKGFAVAHDLVDGDAVVFQLIKRTTFKVYIIRVNGSAKKEQSIAP